MRFPLLLRELLIQGRSPGTFWLRVVVAGFGLATLALMWGLEQYSQWKGNGAFETQTYTLVVFGATHVWQCVVLGLGGALFTADCLARERRDGTLGLLFLTPLRPRDVLLGKCAAQLLRLAGFWLAAIPLMSVPLLLGGLRGLDLLYALMGELTAGFGGVAAGLLATSLCERWGRAMFVALAWGVVTYGLIAIAGFTAASLTWCQFTQSSFQSETLIVTPVLPILVWMGLPLLNVTPRPVGAPPTSVVLSAEVALWAMAATAILLFLSSCAWSFWILHRQYGKTARRVSPPRAPSTNPAPAGDPIPAAACSPSLPPVAPRGGVDDEFPSRWTLLVTSLHRWLRTPPKGFDANPVYWRERCGILPRIGLWLAPLVLLLASGLTQRIFDHYHLNSSEWLAFAWMTPPLAWLAAVFYCAGSFRSEHEEGTLELILCTPISPWNLITGRLRNLVIIVVPSLFTAFVLIALGQTANPYADFAQSISESGLGLLPAAICLAVAALGLPFFRFWIRTAPLEQRPNRRMLAALALGGIVLGGLVWFPYNGSGGSRQQSAAEELQSYVFWSSYCGLTSAMVALYASARRHHPLMAVIVGVAGGLILPVLLTKGLLAFLLEETIDAMGYRQRESITSIAWAILLAPILFFSILQTGRILVHRSFHDDSTFLGRWFRRGKQRT